MATVRIRCVYDEGAKVGTTLIGARGDSFLLEADGQRTLFDTGRRGRYLLHNMERMDIGADSVDRVAISSASLDSIGGLDAFMGRRSSKVEVYAHESAWQAKRLLSPLISEENVGGIVRCDVKDWVRLSDSLWLTPPVMPGSNEVAAVINTPKGAVVVSGGGYDGLQHTLDIVKGRHGKIRAVVGGAGLRKAKQAQADALAAALTDSFGSPELHLNGSTSAEGIQKMRVALGKDAVRDFFAGDELGF